MTSRVALALVAVLCVCAACGGTVVAPPGSGGAGSSGSSGVGGGATESKLDQYCEARTAAKSAASCPAKIDVDECKARVDCEAVLLSHPGDPLLDCPVEDPCNYSLPTCEEVQGCIATRYMRCADVIY